jgi:ABC-type antimicrobial peptide transport system permease subunit
LGTLRQEVASLDPDLAVSGVMTLEEFKRRPLSAAETGASLATAFGLLALVLAAVGLFGAVSYAAARRTREMGLRMALGAGRGDILRLVLAGTLRLGVAGVLLGLAAAAAAARVLSGTLHGVEPRDPLVFGLAPALLLGVALIAGLIPALRAARIDPMTAIRRE